MRAAIQAGAVLVAATFLVGCGEVKGPDVVGVWTHTMKDAESGISVAVELTIKADRTVGISFLADVGGISDKKQGTWRPKNSTTVEFTFKDGADTHIEPAKLLSPDVLELDEAGDKMKFQRKKDAATTKTKETKPNNATKKAAKKAA
ncbi:MAG: hypothetical protein QM811_15310 [Pirellulales bacterium]